MSSDTRGVPLPDPKQDRRDAQSSSKGPSPAGSVLRQLQIPMSDWCRSLAESSSRKIPDEGSPGVECRRGWAHGTQRTSVRLSALI